MEAYSRLEEKLKELKPELDKFYIKGVKVAGIRARKRLQELKRLAQQIRSDIQESKAKG